MFDGLVVVGTSDGEQIFNPCKEESGELDWGVFDKTLGGDATEVGVVSFFAVKIESLELTVVGIVVPKLANENLREIKKISKKVSIISDLGH